MRPPEEPYIDIPSMCVYALYTTPKKRKVLVVASLSLLERRREMETVMEVLDNSECFQEEGTVCVKKPRTGTFIL